MLSFSPEKLFIVGLIALMVLGPDRLPEAARNVGRFVATVRRLSSGFQTEMRDALTEPRDAFNAALGAEFQPLDVRRSVRDVITSTFSPPAPPSDGSPEGGLPGPAPEAHPTESPDAPRGLDHPDDPTLN